MHTIRASEFKAKCLAILDEVERTGEPVVILKRGQPVARLVPPALGNEKYPQRSLGGTVEILGDVLDPVLPAGRPRAEKGGEGSARFGAFSKVWSGIFLGQQPKAFAVLGTDRSEVTAVQCDNDVGAKALGQGDR